jgi:hypothetical protein
MFHLINQCTIQRATVTTDPYGNDKETFSDHARRVPCRLITTVQKAADGITGQFLVSTGYKLLLAPDQDVIAGDRITEVVDRAGDSVAGEFDVVARIPSNGAMARIVTLELEKVH